MAIVVCRVDHLRGAGILCPVPCWRERVVFIVRSLQREDQPAGAAGSRALDILDEGFARGEIDRQEYEERRRILSDRN